MLSRFALLVDADQFAEADARITGNWLYAPSVLSSLLAGCLRRAPERRTTEGIGLCAGQKVI